MTGWPLLVYILFSVKLSFRSRWVRGLLAVSVLYTLFMFATGYYISEQAYSKFYEAIFPYRFQIWRHLPNVAQVFYRIHP